MPEPFDISSEALDFAFRFAAIFHVVLSPSQARSTRRRGGAKGRRGNVTSWTHLDSVRTHDSSVVRGTLRHCASGDSLTPLVYRPRCSVLYSERILTTLFSIPNEPTPLYDARIPKESIPLYSERTHATPLDSERIHSTLFQTNPRHSTLFQTNPLHSIPNESTHSPLHSIP